MSVYVSAELRRLGRARFASRCAYCQTAEELSVVVFEIEHIVPRSAGGQTVFDNLCLSCPTCNRHKADRMEAKDDVTGTEAPFFHPQQQQWSDHFSWNDDFTEIVGLTPIGRATAASLRMNRAKIVSLRRMWVILNEHPPPSDVPQ